MTLIRRTQKRIRNSSTGDSSCHYFPVDITFWRIPVLNPETQLDVCVCHQSVYVSTADLLRTILASKKKTRAKSVKKVAGKTDRTSG